MQKMLPKMFSVALSALLLGSICAGPMPQAEAASAQQIQARSRTAIANFKQRVPQANEVLQDAKGLLIFPHLYNAGFIFGGKYGEGELLVGNQVAGYYNLVGLSWGFQLGGQRKSLIIAFMTDDALNKFRNSEGWDLGADASVAVIDMGTEGRLRVSQMNKPVLAFVVDQKGLMGGVSLQGSKITRISK